MYIFFTHLLIMGHVNVFAIMNNAQMNMGVQIPLQYSDFISFRYTHKSGVPGPCVSPIINFLRNQNHTKIPFSSHPHQHLQILIFR